MIQNSSGLKISVITSQTAPSCAYENIGSIWYETDTDKVKTTKLVPGLTKTTAPTGVWGCSDCSEDGRIVYYGIGQVGGSNTDFLYSSSDYGMTWETKENPGIKNWTGVCCSSNGQKVYASHHGGFLYSSSDYGGTWTQTSCPSGLLSGVCCSSDGKYVYTQITYGFLYSSSDYGGTWTQTSCPSGGISYSMACSSDGSIVAITTNGGGGLYISRDYGVTWETKTEFSAKYNRVISISSTGKKMILGVLGFLVTEYVYISNDYGETWIRQDSLGGSQFSNTVKVSKDGNVFFAVKVTATDPVNVEIFISKNLGGTWYLIPNSGTKNNYSSISCSYNSTHTYFISSNYGIFKNNAISHFIIG